MTFNDNGDRLAAKINLVSAEYPYGDGNSGCQPAKVVEVPR